ncbi:MAG: DUF1028 domain-containing protein [Bacteroidales bacterium]|nr:DUF1028 domain-containing protein [Bacteroidales bacterium]
MRKSFILLILVAVLFEGYGHAQEMPRTNFAHTFSIVARDQATGEMAVGVQSHWFSVGTLVSWGESGVGVVATQSFVNPSYGPEGLRLMAEGMNAAEALDILVKSDEGREFRQAALLDNKGGVSAWTGDKCVESAGHVTGENYSVQANMMLNDKVVPAMSKAFEENGDLPLAERIVKVLQAAQAAGGDIRGKQSAVLIVVGGEPVAGPWLDKKVDLRVDDHSEPLAELERLLKVHRAYEHMNAGDLAIENNDMATAMREYEAAAKMFPENLEMRYWKAVAMVNNSKVGEALPIFKEIFLADPNWREMTRRLPRSGLLTVTGADLKRILDQ